MSRKITTTTLLAMALVLSACQASYVEKNWGEAFNANVRTQTDAPELATANASEPSPQGLDGRSADDAMNGYRAAQQPSAGPSLPLPMIVTGSESLGR